MKSRRMLTPVLVLLAVSAVPWLAGACGESADEGATPAPATSSPPGSSPTPTPSPEPEPRRIREPVSHV